MKRVGILLVMGWLGVVGPVSSAGAQMFSGHVQQISDVRDRNGSSVGSLDDDGTVRDRNGSYVGSIDRDGTLRDRNGSSVGSIDKDRLGEQLSREDRTTGALILLHRLPR